MVKISHKTQTEHNIENLGTAIVFGQEWVSLPRCILKLPVAKLIAPTRLNAL